MSTPRADARPARPAPIRYSLGLDLGKATDYTALAIAEEHPEVVGAPRPGVPPAPIWAQDPAHRVRHLQRWPLRTPYHAIAADVAAIYADLARRPWAEVALFADATGVGSAVIELLLAQPALKAGRLEAVTITAGREVARVDGGWHVAKGELVAAAQLALQRGTLEVSPHLPDAPTLRAELASFEVTLTEAANATFSHRTGRHDDLVLAVALALWGARRPRPRPFVAAVGGQRREIEIR